MKISFFAIFHWVNGRKWGVISCQSLACGQEDILADVHPATFLLLILLLNRMTVASHIDAHELSEIIRGLQEIIKIYSCKWGVTFCNENPLLCCLLCYSCNGFAKPYIRPSYSCSWITTKQLSVLTHKHYRWIFFSTLWVCWMIRIVQLCELGTTLLIIDDRQPVQASGDMWSLQALLAPPHHTLGCNKYQHCNFTPVIIIASPISDWESSTHPL